MQINETVIDGNPTGDFWCNNSMGQIEVSDEY